MRLFNVSSIYLYGGGGGHMLTCVPACICFFISEQSYKELLADEQFEIKRARMVTERGGVWVLGWGMAEFASLSDR